MEMLDGRQNSDLKITSADSEMLEVTQVSFVSKKLDNMM
jgi:hypothetical protein